MEQFSITRNGKTTRVQPHPISIDPDVVASHLPEDVAMAARDVKSFPASFVTAISRSPEFANTTCRRPAIPVASLCARDGGTISSIAESKAVLIGDIPH